MDEQQVAEMTARIADLERKVDWLYRNAGYNSGYAVPNAPATSPGGVSAAAGVSAEVLELVRQSQPIHAIKLYRQQTGVGLKEAKDVIDGLK